MQWLSGGEEAEDALARAENAFTFQITNIFLQLHIDIMLTLSARTVSIC